MSTQGHYIERLIFLKLTSFCALFVNNAIAKHKKFFQNRLPSRAVSSFYSSTVCFLTLKCFGNPELCFCAEFRFKEYLLLEKFN